MFYEVAFESGMFYYKILGDNIFHTEKSEKEKSAHLVRYLFQDSSFSFFSFTGGNDFGTNWTFGAMP